MGSVGVLLGYDVGTSGILVLAVVLLCYNVGTLVLGVVLLCYNVGTSGISVFG